MDDELDVKGMIQCLLKQQGRSGKQQKEVYSLLMQMKGRMGYLHELLAEVQVTIHDKIEAMWMEKMDEHERMLEDMSGCDDSSRSDASSCD